MKEKFRGHTIEESKESWIFTDTKEKVSETWEQRPCGYCNKMNTPEGYDGCIGYIPGALNACCGHGNEKDSYIQFPDRRIEGSEVKKYLSNE